MKQQEVFKKIGTILKELNDQYDYLDTSDNKTNDLELELFVANAHFLAEHSEVLRKLNQQNSTIASEPKKIEEKYFEPVVQQLPPVSETKEEPAAAIETKVADNLDTPVPHIDLSANGADDDFSYIRPDEPEIIKHELVLDESQNWEDEDDAGFMIEELADADREDVHELPIAVPEPEPIEEEPPEPVNEVPVVEVNKELPTPPAKKEMVTEEPLTINQMMSAKLNKTDSHVVQHATIQPVADLKQAITLNDKLLYIKDLFNGYNLAYSEAIDILNRFSTFDEAEDFLTNNYAVKNHWESKPATVDKFYELLRRRF